MRAARTAREPIRFPTGEEEAEARKQLETMLSEQRRRTLERDRLFPGADAKQRMVALCRLFPSIVEEGCDGIDPFDAQLLVRWALLRGGSSGLLHAIRFVLHVWNSNARWPEQLRKEAAAERPTDPSKGSKALWQAVQSIKADLKANPRGFQTTEERLAECFEVVAPFNLSNAWSVWDEQHRAAVQTWLSYPFWP